MAARRIYDCDWSVFISYAHDDDLAWNSWVTCFSKELGMTLPGRLRIGEIPPIHLSRKNGPIVGDLDEALCERIAASFAMILVVHDNYAASGWCQKELEYFKLRFGEDGFRERLYIVALSKKAILDVTATDDWKALCPSPNQLWMPFFQDDDTTMPIGIYSDRGIVANAFWNPFVRLREDLAAKVTRSLEASAGMHAFPSPAVGARFQATSVAHAAEVEERAPANDDDGCVRIYIESNRNEVDHWESVGVQIIKSWDTVVAGMALVPPLYVRPYGLPMDKIDQHPRLDDADGVVLLWGHKTSDSLVAQIKKVERKLPGPDLAPGVVAYLMPPQEQTLQPVSAWGWKVLRFSAPDSGGIEVIEQDAPGLESFLRKVLGRKKQRRGRADVAITAASA